MNPLPHMPMLQFAYASYIRERLELRISENGHLEINGDQKRARDLMDCLTEFNPDVSENTVRNIRNWLRNDTMPQLTLPRSLYNAFEHEVRILSYPEFVATPQHYGKYLLEDGVSRVLRRTDKRLEFRLEDIFRLFQNERFEFSFHANVSGDAKRKIAIGMSMMVVFILH